MTKAISAATNKTDSLAGVRPKMRLHGKVSSVELFGILVDVGLGLDGLVHISDLNEKKDGNGGDKFEIGQEITVWVKQVEEKARFLAFTLKEPLTVEWNELKPGQVYSGKVVRMEKFGAFIDIGAERPGLVHVREITTGRVAHPDEVVTLGEEVEAQLLVFGLALVGLIFSGWLTYVEIAILQAICPYCVVSAMLICAIFALSVIGLVRDHLLTD